MTAKLLPSNVGRIFWVALIACIVMLLLPFLFHYLGCSNSDWKCSGDNMGGFMMIYALGFMLPSFGVLLVGSFFLLKETLAKRKFLTAIHVFGLLLYLTIFMVSAYELAINDMQYFQAWVQS